MTSYSQLFSGGGAGGAEDATTRAAPASRVHGKVGNLKSISTRRNTYLQLIIIVYRGALLDILQDG